jgi:hypothetical protein
MPKRKVRTARQRAASRANLEKARQARLYNKGKLAFTRSKALDTLHTEGYAIPKSIASTSVNKSYQKWKSFYLMSLMRPTGKSGRSGSHAATLKAVEGHKVRQRLFGA